MFNRFKKIMFIVLSIETI